MITSVARFRPFFQLGEGEILTLLATAVMTILERKVRPARPGRPVSAKGRKREGGGNTTRWNNRLITERGCVRVCVLDLRGSLGGGRTDLRARRFYGLPGRGREKHTSWEKEELRPGSKLISARNQPEKKYRAGSQILPASSHGSGLHLWHPFP